MNRLVDLATVLRSKNSGPFQITLDILFDNVVAYQRVVQSGLITKATISSLYSIDESSITAVVFFEKALGIKITYDRPISSGSAKDRDVYGAQQHAPLMNLLIP